MNKVILKGNLGNDPELRKTFNGASVCQFQIATNEHRTDKDGQRQTHTEWHRIVVWNKQADNAAKYLSKGDTVLIEGKIRTRNWDDKDGNKRYATEIIAFSIDFIITKKGKDTPQGSQPQDVPPIDATTTPEDDLPF